MLGYTEIGTSDPKPDCIERNVLHQRCIFCIHPSTAAHGTCLEEKERKNVWLGLTAVKLAQEVGFVLPPALAGNCLLTVLPKGRANPLDPFAYTSIPQFVQKSPPK